MEGGVVRAGSGYLALLACVLGATTKKGVSFFEEKSAPQRKS